MPGGMEQCGTPAFALALGSTAVGDANYDAA
jgi:hypothetical protein